MCAWPAARKSRCAWPSENRVCTLAPLVHAWIAPVPFARAHLGRAPRAFPGVGPCPASTRWLRRHMLTCAGSRSECVGGKWLHGSHWRNLDSHHVCVLIVAFPADHGPSDRLLVRPKRQHTWLRPGGSWPSGFPGPAGSVGSSARMCDRHRYA